MPDEHCLECESLVCADVPYCEKCMQEVARDFEICEADRRHANAVRVLRASARDTGNASWLLEGGDILNFDLVDEKQGRGWGWCLLGDNALGPLYLAEKGTRKEAREMARALLALVPGIKND